MGNSLILIQLIQNSGFSSEKADFWMNKIRNGDLSQKEIEKFWNEIENQLPPS